MLCFGPLTHFGSRIRAPHISGLPGMPLRRSVQAAQPKLPEQSVPVYSLIVLKFGNSWTENPPTLKPFCPLRSAPDVKRSFGSPSSSQTVYLNGAVNSCTPRLVTWYVPMTRPQLPVPGRNFSCRESPSNVMPSKAAGSLIKT